MQVRGYKCKWRYVYLSTPTHQLTTCSILWFQIVEGKYTPLINGTMLGDGLPPVEVVTYAGEQSPSGGSAGSAGGSGASGRADGGGSGGADGMSDGVLAGVIVASISAGKVFHAKFNSSALQSDRAMLLLSLP